MGRDQQIVNNRIQNNQGDGIGMENGSDSEIADNIITDNGGDGIDDLVPDGTTGPLIVNNTIAGNAGIGILAFGFPSGCQIINNVVVGNPALNVGLLYGGPPFPILGNPSLPVVEFNDFYSPEGSPFGGNVITNLSGIAGNISTNPLFTCIPGGDFHLLAGSACIDAGTNRRLLGCR